MGDTVAMQFARLGSEHEADVLRVMGEAFAQDDAFKRVLLCQKTGLAGYFEALLQLCWRAKDCHVFGGGSGESVESAVVIFGPKFRAGLRGSMAYLHSYRRRLGLRRLMRLLAFGPRFERRADLPQDCFHIQHLGTADRVRGQGLGGALLEYVCVEAAALGHEWVKLEVEVESAARRFYLRHGFEAAGRFSLYQQAWDILVKNTKGSAGI